MGGEGDERIRTAVSDLTEGEERIRTAVHGFAGRYLTTRSPRRGRASVVTAPGTVGAMGQPSLGLIGHPVAFLGRLPALPDDLPHPLLRPFTLLRPLRPRSRRHEGAVALS